MPTLLTKEIVQIGWTNTESPSLSPSKNRAVFPSIPLVSRLASHSENRADFMSKPSTAQQSTQLKKIQRDDHKANLLASA